MVAVEAVHVTLLLAGERGRGRGWRLWGWRGHDETGADLRSDSAGAGASWTEVTIQCPVVFPDFSLVLMVMITLLSLLVIRLPFCLPALARPPAGTSLWKESPLAMRLHSEVSGLLGDW